MVDKKKGKNVKKILTVVGARPQFVKGAMVSRAIDTYNRTRGDGDVLAEVIVHTGQHYDDNMSAVFFREMEIPEPDYHLNVGGLPHGAMTGRMLEKTEQIILAEKPDMVLVYGDTNSTLAGALAAAKLGVSLAHVEAGLRSFDRAMPEEINRVVVDHISDQLFCPTQTAVKNLADEGVSKSVYEVGDVMCDSLLRYGPLAKKESRILGKLNIRPLQYILATLHRPVNTDNAKRLRSILDAFQCLEEQIILAAHPRFRQAILDQGHVVPSNVRLIDPVGYLDMLALEQEAKAIVTDSGGVQKEAYLFGVPCITLREETEWTETVAHGWNVLVGADKEKTVAAVGTVSTPDDHPPLFGDGRAAEKIVSILMQEGIS